MEPCLSRCVTCWLLGAMGAVFNLLFLIVPCLSQRLFAHVVLSVNNHPIKRNHLVSRGCVLWHNDISFTFGVSTAFVAFVVYTHRPLPR